MILKKPYAFLIKHFKLIHIIMTILFGYLIYKTNVILSFLNRYMDSKELVTGKNLVAPLFSVIIYIVLAIIILLCVAIFILMRYKKKPYGFYFLNILSCIGLIVIYVFVQTTIGTMEEKVISLQTVRLARDLLTIAILLQTSSLVVNFIRSIGFNIKKFNFEDDYAELNIESKDNEEFELELSVDTNKLRRNWRKRIRHFKYVYAEHKYIINLLGLLVILVLVFAISFVLGLFDKRYRENDLFTTNQYIMGIMDSYVVTENYKGNTINDSQFVILRLNIENMKKAISYFEGEHDFKAFKSSGTSSKSSVRTIYDAKVTREGEIVTIELTGNGFLYNMVRIIAGTLVDVGEGKIKPEDVKKILLAKDRLKAGRTLPPTGLYLVNVEYESN